MQTRTPEGSAAITTLSFSEGELTVSDSVPLGMVTVAAVLDATVAGGISALLLDAEEGDSAEGGYATEWRYFLHQLDGDDWRETSLGTLAYKRSELVKPDICRACGCSGSSSTSVALVLVAIWRMTRRKASSQREGGR
jgi:uncharacterized protein (TIGR03382 family)